MDAKNQLVVLEKARKDIALVKTVDEAKQIRDKAEALRHYAKQQGLSLEMQNDCAEIKLRAERRAGELLTEMEMRDGGDATRARLHNVTELPPKLEDIGITRIQSHRWQLETEVPADKFEGWVTQVKDRGDELTSVGLRRLALQLKVRQSPSSSLPFPTTTHKRNYQTFNRQGE